MNEKIKFNQNYNSIISIENILLAWREFICGKRNRKDVQEFERNLMDNIFELHRDLISKKYRHSCYEKFSIADPKPRIIHKAKVRDRLLHHALYRLMYPFFDRTFISHSYSCRKGKGIHNALNAFRDSLYKSSKNHTKAIWILKCDIRKFFASINHSILIKIIGEYVVDLDIKLLLSEVIESFSSTSKGVGIPLGNLTSQLFANIYMNKFDHFVKHKIKAKYYIRYADDFVFISQDKSWLLQILSQIKKFLWKELRLELHPDKVTINTLTSGIDFLGWIHFKDHRVVRLVTRKRLLHNIEIKKSKTETVQSYLGLLKHGNTEKLKVEIQSIVDIAANKVEPYIVS